MRSSGGRRHRDGAADPDEVLYTFFESAHAAAADLAGWDRDALERPRGYRPLDEPF